MKKRSLFSRIGSKALAIVLISLIITVWAKPASSKSIKHPIGKKRLVPSSLLRWPENSSDYAVLVDKSAQKVLLYNRDNLFSPEKVYDCSTGENNGPKSKKNDRKTPEGIYFFTKSYGKRDLSPIYGVRAFPINYPNSIDKSEGKDGYGIWFHGSDKPLKPKDSNGCIVMDNKNIDELASFIKLHDTPVVISSRIEMVQPERQREEARNLEQVVENWRTAWESKDIERYMSFYNRRFTAGGKNWEQWKRYKARLAKRYKQIRVDTDELHLLENNGLVLAIFNQTYSTSGFGSRGKKKLYLRKNSNEWKIIGEFFQPSKTKKAPVKKRVLAGLTDIKEFINLWIKAWEKKDLKRYISCYDARFRSRGMDLNAWEKHRKKLNRKYRSVKIDISGLKIKRSSSNTAKVSFKQDYQADIYRDFGLKEMVLTKRGKDWKIKEEKWTPMNRRSRL